MTEAVEKAAQNGGKLDEVRTQRKLSYLRGIDRLGKFGGTAFAIYDYKNSVQEKGWFWGSVDSGIKAIPWFGTLIVFAELAAGEELITKDGPKARDPQAFGRGWDAIQEGCLHFRWTKPCDVQSFRLQSGETISVGKELFVPGTENEPAHRSHIARIRTVPGQRGVADVLTESGIEKRIASIGGVPDRVMDATPFK